MDNCKMTFLTYDSNKMFQSNKTAHFSLLLQKEALASCAMLKGNQWSLTENMLTILEQQTRNISKAQLQM